MIIVGKVKELDKVKDYPTEVKEKIREQLEILDNCYGTDRNLKKDLGGYIAVVESKEDIKILQKEYLDIYQEIPEIQLELEGDTQEKWLYLLYILSSDYAIGIIGNTKIIEEDRLQVE